jgi:hypothetical protein
MRSTDACRNCGDVRELAAHGLCFACYRAQQRSAQRNERQVDRHNPAIRREHKKLFKAHSAVMGGLSDLGVGREDVMSIKRIIQPYLVPIQEFLDSVNAEQEKAEFTVHPSPPKDRSQ